jgi:hypothetical protein
LRPSRHDQYLRPSSFRPERSASPEGRQARRDQSDDPRQKSGRDTSTELIWSDRRHPEFPPDARRPVDRQRNREWSPPWETPATRTSRARSPADLFEKKSPGAIRYTAMPPGPPTEVKLFCVACSSGMFIPSELAFSARGLISKCFAIIESGRKGELRICLVILLEFGGIILVSRRYS